MNENSNDFGYTQGNRSYVSFMNEEDWRALLEQTNDFTIDDVLKRIRNADVASGVVRSHQEDARQLNVGLIEHIIGRTTDPDKIRNMKERMNVLISRAEKLLSNQEQLRNIPYVGLAENGDEKLDNTKKYLKSFIDAANKLLEVIDTKLEQLTPTS